jgi:hypothetical protein
MNSLDNYKERSNAKGFHNFSFSDFSLGGRTKIKGVIKINE